MKKKKQVLEMTLLLRIVVVDHTIKVKVIDPSKVSLEEFLQKKIKLDLDKE